MNDLVVSPGTSMLSIRCSSSVVPRVTETRPGSVPGKQRRAVGPGKHTGLDRDRTDGVEVAPVHPLTPFEHLLPHHPVFDVIQLGSPARACSANSGVSFSRTCSFTALMALDRPDLSWH